MPISYEPIEEKKLESLKEVNDWINDTQSNLKRVPVAGIIQNQAIFKDDEYFGDGDVMFRFNEHSISSFCQRLGFRVDYLNMIEAPLLTSQVLNDLIQQQPIREKLKNEEFVIDTSKNLIVGIVSQSYVGYSNKQFLFDIDNYFKQNKDNDLKFDHAYGFNTELTIRYLSEKIHADINGPNGKATDRSTLGLELRNSMVRTFAVSINYFILRLICTNGMMVPAGRSINRIYHSGNSYSFNQRLQKRFDEVMRKIDDIKNMLEKLGNIPFNANQLAGNSTANQSIFNIIPALKQTICDKEKMYFRYPSDITEERKQTMKLEHDANIITLIPKHYGGEQSGRVFKSSLRNSVTMFDFLNVFTEHAKNCESFSQQLQIEERTGALAKYISDNAKKFSS